MIKRAMRPFFIVTYFSKILRKRSEMRQEML